MSGENQPDGFDSGGMSRESMSDFIDRNIRQSRSGNIDTGIDLGKRTFIVDFDSFLMGLFGGNRIAESGNAEPITTDAPIVSPGTRILLASAMEYGLHPVFISARPERQRPDVVRILLSLIADGLELRMIPGSGSHDRRSFKTKVIEALLPEHQIMLAFDNVTEDEAVYAAHSIDVCTLLPYSLMKGN